MPACHTASHTRRHTARLDLTASYHNDLTTRHTEADRSTKPASHNVIANAVIAAFWKRVAASATLPHLAVMKA